MLDYLGDTWVESLHKDSVLSSSPVDTSHLTSLVGTNRNIYQSLFFHTLHFTVSKFVSDLNEFDVASVSYLRVTTLEPRCGLRIHCLPTST
jgi:hypothetical protein